MACLISENTTEYFPIILGALGITASMYNYYIHHELLQSERDNQLLIDFGTVALAGFVSTIVLKSIRLGTCNVDISNKA